MGRLLDEFAERNPHDVVCREGETFVAAERVGEVIAEAELRGIRVLGLEGFLVGDDVVYVADGRVADFSADSAEGALGQARALVGGPWSTPPGTDDRVPAGAVGRHMIAVALDDEGRRGGDRG